MYVCAPYRLYRSQYTINTLMPKTKYVILDRTN